MAATGSSDGEAVTQWAALAGVTAALAMFGAAQGLSYPLFTLLMQRQGMSPALIGLSAAMMPVGLILSASFVPAAVRLFGARNLAVGSSLIGALCFLGIGYLQDWVAWFVIRFFVGLVINPLYVLGEVWALSLAPPSRRGRVMGVFNALMGAGYAAGPLILITVGASGWPPFIAAIAGFAFCALILRAVSSKLTGFEDDGQPASDLFGFARLAPALLLAVLVSAAVQQSTYALIPVFGAGYALPEAKLAALVTALSAGNILLQIPLGLMAERFGGRAMIVFCALATAACALSLPVLITTPLVWPVLVVMGGRLRRLHHGAGRARQPLQGNGAGRRQRRLRLDVGRRRHCRPARRWCLDAGHRPARPAGGHRRPRRTAGELRALPILQAPKRLTGLSGAGANLHQSQ